MKTLKECMKSVRVAGVPLVCVETAEPTGAFEIVRESLNGKFDDLTVVVWNLVSGLNPANKKSVPWASEANNNNDPSLETARPDELLRKLVKLPDGGVAILFGAEKILGDITVRQGLWNLRDLYKTTGRTIVMFATVGTKFEADLKDDVVVLRHDLPTQEWLKNKAVSLCEDAGVSKPSNEVLEKAVDATIGLTEFSAEQVLAMSISKKGYDLEDLWARKRSAIEQTNGLTVWKGGESFADVGGNDNIKEFFGKLVTGKRRPRCIVFIDEIEKAMAGQGDTSGTNQEMLGKMLSWMQDTSASGVIFVGVAGSGKSAISKAVGNEANVPTIAFDLSAMKGSLVGESGARLRSALATVDAIGQGSVLVIATCNKIDNLPPELRRRFTLGTFFFDLPTEDERKAIWNVYLKKYNLSGKLPNDASWTGAEIKQCCDVADRLGISLVDASEYVVPVARSASEQIENLRKQANGRFLSASYKGVYTCNQTSTVINNSNRKVSV